MSILGLKPTLQELLAYLRSFLALLGILGVLGFKKASVTAATQIEIVDCKFIKTNNGFNPSAALIGTYARLPLGPVPKTVEVADEFHRGRTHTNPAAEEADLFLRAASAVRIAHGAKNAPSNQLFSVLVAQDSRRKIGVAQFNASVENLSLDPHRARQLGLPKVGAINTDGREAMKEYENDHRDYESYRKKVKRDFEAMTTLPNGQVLVLGSGSDLKSYVKSDLINKQSFRSQGLVLAGDGRLIASYDLLPFYLEVQNNPAVVGGDYQGSKAEINIEGVTIRPSTSGAIIGFYHRGNMNGNGHNALVEFPLEPWFETLKTTQSLSLSAARSLWKKLGPLRIVAIKTPRIASLSDPTAKTFPVTLNDALFGYLRNKATALIPVAVEAEFVDSQGFQHDGEVIFAGMMIWENMDKPHQGSCTIDQLPGEDLPGKVSKFGKIEGLAAWSPTGKSPFFQSLLSDHSLLVGVTDVDSEVQPSILSILGIHQTKPSNPRRHPEAKPKSLD